MEADILPGWWRRQDAEARQGATARPPDPPGGPVGIALPGKSAAITPPDAPPLHLWRERLGPFLGPFWVVSRGLPSLRLVSRKSVPGLAGSLDALSTLTQIFCVLSITYRITYKSYT